MHKYPLAWMATVFQSLILYPAYFAYPVYERGNMQDDRTVSDEMLQRAYTIMAKIVRDYGDRYLPIFKRLHEEREARKAKQGLKDIALQIAKDMQH